LACRVKYKWIEFFCYKCNAKIAHSAASQKLSNQ
jgi:hypothetical protein